MALILTRDAEKQMSAMPRADRDRIVRLLREIAAAPGMMHPGVTALAGLPGTFRVRQGDWRAVFSVEDGDVIVDRVQHRREVYR